MGARGGFVHPVAFLQQLEQLLHRDAGVRRAPQGEDLPKQHPKRPAVGRESEFTAQMGVGLQPVRGQS